MDRPRRFDLAIFDLDGTLADSVPDIARALGATLAEAGLPVPPLEMARGFVGDGAAKLIERALPRSEAGRDLGPLVARFLVHYGEHVADGTRLYPGIPALLDEIAARGMTAAVLTNKPAPLARALLAALHVADRFAAVVGDGDGFPRKPDPAAARALVAAHAVGDVTRAVVIGDGLPDIRQAHAVPCASIAAAWGYVPAERLRAESPTHLAESPAAVLSLL